jgi:hypothetical protein
MKLSKQEMEDLFKLNGYYVYICYVNEDPVYVGKGKGKRLLHCTSGRSHNKKLNTALSDYGSKAFAVHIVYRGLDERRALEEERKLIKYFLVQGYELYNCDPETLWFDPQVNYSNIIDYENIPEWVTEKIE